MSSNAKLFIIVRTYNFHVIGYWGSIRGVPIIGLAIGNTLYRLIFFSNRIGMCIKLLADPK